jgi:hypothetical protein
MKTFQQFLLVFVLAFVTMSTASAGTDHNPHKAAPAFATSENFTLDTFTVGGHLGVKPGDKLKPWVIAGGGTDPCPLVCFPPENCSVYLNENCRRDYERYLNCLDTCRGGGNLMPSRPEQSGTMPIASVTLPIEENRRNAILTRQRLLPVV